MAILASVWGTPAREVLVKRGRVPYEKGGPMEPPLNQPYTVYKHVVPQIHH